MARVVFAKILERHLSCPVTEADGATVRQVLEHVFRENPKLEGYILDDQGALRKHVAIFVDGTMITDRTKLNDPVPTGGEVYVLQSLTGG